MQNTKKAFYIFTTVIVVLLIGTALRMSSMTEQGATVTIRSVSPNLTATALSANEKTIVWTSTNFPAGMDVNINLLEKISSSPAQYILVRTLASHIANTGSYAWTPNQNENKDNYYVEVTCAENSNSCQVSGVPVQIQ